MSSTSLARLGALGYVAALLAPALAAVGVDWVLRRVGRVGRRAGARAPAARRDG